MGDSESRRGDDRLWLHTDRRSLPKSMGRIGTRFLAACNPSGVCVSKRRDYIYHWNPNRKKKSSVVLRIEHCGEGVALTTGCSNGGLITYFAYNAYRHSGATPFGILAVGFAIVTLGLFLAGGAHQAIGLRTATALLIESALTAVGFAVILYSLYIE